MGELVGPHGHPAMHGSPRNPHAQTHCLKILCQREKVACSVTFVEHIKMLWTLSKQLGRIVKEWQGPHTMDFAGRNLKFRHCIRYKDRKISNKRSVAIERRPSINAGCWLLSVVLKLIKRRSLVTTQRNCQRCQSTSHYIAALSGRATSTALQPQKPTWNESTRLWSRKLWTSMTEIL